MLASLANFATDYTYNYIPSTGNHALAIGIGTIVMGGLIGLAIAIVIVVAMWKVFAKAGRPGWAAIIPLYNGWVLAEIAGKPGWWGLYPLIAWVPIIGWIISVVVSIIIALGVAQNFGKSSAFGVVGLWLFSVIGYLILGFGSATYSGATPSVAGSPAEAPTSLEAPSPTKTTINTNKPKPPKLIQ